MIFAETGDMAEMIIVATEKSDSLYSLQTHCINHPRRCFATDDYKLSFYVTLHIIYPRYILSV